MKLWLVSVGCCCAFMLHAQQTDSTQHQPRTQSLRFVHSKENRADKSKPSPEFPYSHSIPKGNVFCRMEEKLAKSTKIWIKVGVK